MRPSVTLATLWPWTSTVSLCAITVSVLWNLMSGSMSSFIHKDQCMCSLSGSISSSSHHVSFLCLNRGLTWTHWCHIFCERCSVIVMTVFMWPKVISTVLWLQITKSITTVSVAPENILSVPLMGAILCVVVWHNCLDDVSSTSCFAPCVRLDSLLVQTLAVGSIIHFDRQTLSANQTNKTPETSSSSPSEPINKSSFSQICSEERWHLSLWETQWGQTIVVVYLLLLTMSTVTSLIVVFTLLMLKD